MLYVLFLWILNYSYCLEFENNWIYCLIHAWGQRRPAHRFQEMPLHRYMLETAPDLRHVPGSDAVTGAGVCEGWWRFGMSDWLPVCWCWPGAACPSRVLDPASNRSAPNFKPATMGQQPQTFGSLPTGATPLRSSCWALCTRRGMG